MAAHVMVLANRTAASPELVAALLHRSERGPIVATLIMPSGGAGHEAKAAARERIDAALEAWRAAGIERCDGIVCDSGPVEALTEAWDPRRYDEVVVCTLPGESSRWVRSDLPHVAARFTGVSVLHVIARDPALAPHVTPAQAREKAPLGPLSVLAWGGAKTP
jgi:hypothetical protein